MPPPGPSPLADPQHPADLLLYRLAKLAAASGRLVTRLCERRYGITRREWGVLMWLAQQPGLQPSALAERLELDRARVSRAIASLQAKGLVHRAASPQHRSQAALHLTEAGTALHADLWPQVRAINLQLTGVLGAEPLNQLDQDLAALQRQAARLEQHDPHAPDAAACYPPRREGSRHLGQRRAPAPEHP
ncbi:MAG: winged helix-turn-helix transcriptional regulator [Acidovorax sp.]|nr:winged helix-turn-helix transcriptional regulator [Acidovorax sp.]